MQQIWMGAIREEAQRAFDRFVQTYGAKYPKAVQCPTKDRDGLLAFYDFPAEHWAHLRTTNPTESSFATVAASHRQNQGCLSRTTMLTMTTSSACVPRRIWCRIRGSDDLARVIAG